MTVAPVSNSTDPNASPVGTAKPVMSEEFTQFLTLLTTQVENQDPLTPLDSTTFVQQLATFSSLEQQVQTNRTLDAILAAVRG
ncbi:flagellar hook assembly protein FlgD [Parvularcula sp. LCG005]|uniref:flagellar hook assembly protein FlgD n=1 Tax=Parvularcula sp. LCG005 TaxID=3078805 RepID=UPI0029432E0E|nr:flagellar hook capping FlgD N-terminal domain-containing protein [Parvularcula sp. LCG005]WOI52953.1 flagellar hook capping FlgD N-terminal domain-containing protein [Parvularcula sp. LCG005]